MWHSFWLDPATRTGRYLRTLGSSLVLFASATLYSLGVVPLVLAYEDAGSLGLWVLISQIGIWLSALDLGLSTASIRFFVGPVARREISGLRPRFQVTLLLAGLQGTAVALLGLTGPVLATLLSIPSGQRDLFHELLLIQCMTSGISFLSRPFASILLAAQRFEVNYLGNALSFFASLGLAWIGLGLGWGLWSLMAGSILQHGLAMILSFLGVCRMGFMRGLFQGCVWQPKLAFKVISESLSFAVGPLATMMGGILQSVFLSRFFGLESVAAWNVGAKAASVLAQILSKFFESSFSGLSELLEAGRRDRMFDRFGRIFGWSMVICAALALFLLFANGPFIRFWTGGKIDWPAYGTVAVILMLLVGTFHRALSETTKVLILWNSIRFSPLMDLATLLICLLLAYLAGGFGPFVFAAALGPFFGGLAVNILALTRTLPRPAAQLIPSVAKVLLLFLLLGCFLGALKILLD